MRANRRVSGIELGLRRALWRTGARGYRVSARLPGKPDVAFRAARVAILVHGCFWHRCPTCDLPYPRANAAFWRDKFDQNRVRDERVYHELESLGWLPVVVWEHEVRRNLDTVVEKILKHVRERVEATR